MKIPFKNFSILSLLVIFLMLMIFFSGFFNSYYLSNSSGIINFIGLTGLVFIILLTCVFIVIIEFNSSKLSIFNFFRLVILIRFFRFFSSIMERIYSVILIDQKDFVDIEVYGWRVFTVNKIWSQEELEQFLREYSNELMLYVIDNYSSPASLLEFLAIQANDKTNIVGSTKSSIKERLDSLLFDEITRQMSQKEINLQLSGFYNLFDDNFLKFLENAKYGLLILGVTTALFIYIYFYNNSASNGATAPIDFATLSLRDRVLLENKEFIEKAIRRAANARHYIRETRIYLQDKDMPTLYKYVDKYTERLLDPRIPNENGVWIPID